MSLRRLWWHTLVLGVLLSGSLFIAATRVPTVSSLASGPPTAPTPAAASAARPGPLFELPSVDGATIALDDHKGQVVLINVWATWCPPCQVEMPAIEAVYQRYRDQGFSVLAVNQGEERETVQAFMRDYGLSFPALLDHEGAVSRAYRAHSLPSSFFIDRRGIIRTIYLGPISRGALAGTVEQLLREQP
jgi:peroxiredoxin